MYITMTMYSTYIKSVFVSLVDLTFKECVINLKKSRFSYPVYTYILLLVYYIFVLQLPVYVANPVLPTTTTTYINIVRQKWRILGIFRAIFPTSSENSQQAEFVYSPPFGKTLEKSHRAGWGESRALPSTNSFIACGSWKEKISPIRPFPKY